MGKSMISRPSIRDILDSIVPDLEKFYNREKAAGNRNFDEPYDDLKAGILNDILTGNITSDSLQRKSYAHISQCNRKKKRWASTFRSAMQQYKLSSPKNPLHDLSEDYESSSESARERKYGDKSLNEVIGEYMEKVDAWAEESVKDGSWLILYPQIDTLTPKKRYDALCSDLETGIYNGIREKFGENMDVDAALQVYIRDIDDSGPIFANTSRKKYPVSPEDGILSIVPVSEDGTTKMVITVGTDVILNSKNLSSMSVLDSKDQDLFLYIIQKAASGKSFASPEQILETAELGRVLAGTSNTNARIYSDVEARIFKLVTLGYALYKDNPDGTRTQYGAINFLSSAFAETDSSGKKIMRITLSPMVQDAIINNRLRKFPKDTYDMIESPLGKAIFTKIQRDRVKAHLNSEGNQGDCFTYYDKSAMMRYINSASMPKRQLTKEFRAVINEYYEKKIFVKKMEYDSIGEILKVIFFPLSEDEIKDLNNMGFEDENVIDMN